MPSSAAHAARPTHDITFTPVTIADLDRLRHWMDGPHWREWWGDPDFELGQIRNMLEGSDTTRPYLFHIDGAPMGYIQVWFVADNRCEPWITQAPWLLQLPDDAVGVDLSIGPEDALSIGLGSTVLQQFTEQLWDEGHRVIVIDPDPRNARAVRAYEKAGFRMIPEFEGRTGDCLLMRFHPHKNEKMQ
jgi:RimJ/RimL family protein N-acetyltransferase